MSDTRQFNFTVAAAGVATWRQGELFEWREIPGTNMAPAMDHVTNGFLSYSGGALHPTTNKYYIAGGGHADDWSNAIYSLDLTLASPVWVRESGPTPLAQMWGTSVQGFPYVYDGRPASRHTWNGTCQVIPTWGTQGRVLLVGAQAVWGNGNGSFTNLDAWDIAAKDYTWINPAPLTSPYGPNPTLPPIPNGRTAACAVRDTTLGHVWALSTAQGSTAPYYRFNVTSQTWDLTVAQGWSEERRILGYDSNRARIVAFPGSTGTNRFTYFNADGTGLATANNTTGLLFSDGAVIFEPTLDRFVYHPYITGSDSVYLIHPTTFAVAMQATTGSKLAASNSFGIGVNPPHSRFCYVPDYKGVILFNNVNATVRFMRLA